jgi:short-subunit dehydrogenase
LKTMTRELSGRRVLVTGASSGIGRCLAEELGRAGCRLVLTARTQDRLAAVADALNRRNVEAVPVAGDVTVESDRRRFLDAALDHFGGLDVLINNAGIASFAHFADSSEAILRQIVEVNFFAPAELIRSAIPVLVQGQQPAIVNVASMCGRRGLPAWPEYSASKFALCGLTEALRGELARFDIDILLILPGLTRTDLPNHLLRHTGRMKINFDEGMPPEQVAAGIVRSLRRNRTETVLGREAKWILRINRWMPRLVDWLAARRVKKLYAGSS